MKHLRAHTRFSYLRAGPCLALIFLLLVSGCATTTPAQANAFNGLKTLRATVEASLTVFNAGYQAGTFSDAQRTQLQGLYGKYLVADRLAAESLATTLSNDPAVILQNVTILAGDVIRFVQNLKGAP